MAIKNPKVGDKVAYEDRGNPTRLGTITGIAYHVVWDSKSQFPIMEGGPPVTGTIDSLHGEGWREASQPARKFPPLPASRDIPSPAKVTKK